MKKTAFGLVLIVALVGAFFMTLSPHTAGPTVRMGAQFTPATVRIRAGEAVTFSNRTRQTHTATCTACRIDTGDVQPGLEKTLTFGAPGTFALADRYGEAIVTIVVTAPVRASSTPSG